MLTSIEVWNFQSLKHKKIKLSPTVTTLVGPNDKGKSALVRALQLVCLNKLSRSPDGYIRHGKKSLKVKLKFDKHTLIREKGKGVNSYTLDGQRLEAFGKGKVPEQIETLLNVGRENFQRQLDQHFWFSETPGEVSRRLNQMVNLGLVDRSLSHLAAELKQSKGKAVLVADNLKGNKKRVKALEWVPALERKLERVEQAEREAEKATRNASELETLVNAFRDALSELKGLKRILGAGKEAVTMGKMARIARRKYNRLKTLIHDIREAEEFVQLKIPDIRVLVTIRSTADETANRWRRLRFLIEDIQKGEDELWSLKGEIEAKESKLAKLGKNRRCPKCGGKLSSSSRETSTCRKGHQSPEPRKVRTGTL